MSFALDKVVPWGRSYDEYVAMFALTDADLKSRILGCGDGPAGFNSELTKRGGNVTSIDPIYSFDTRQIKNRIVETYETVMTQMRENKRDYVWEVIPSIEQLGQLRMSAIETFLADFDAGKQEGRYIPGALPSLPFDVKKFDLALSSHFLFLYSTHLSADFHLQAILDMLRVSHEVRVFPLLALNGVLSPHIQFLSESLADHGFTTVIKQVAYEFQRGGNEMFIIKPTAPLLLP
ncbi:MAG: SAM-dependent methyltransferase [Sulfuriferula multivorans]|uniref:SAM-dependent methyltransferase n=1 Tax=Sulfuriferula multivorans TaxID=1559896 RepID=A0A7C9TB38_9PROT|nr:SAM-dependent methyltransferase [Sulfuriferula multivorans]